MKDLYYAIYQLLFFLSITVTVEPKSLPLWTWECINNKCVPVKPAPAIKLHPLATCNRLCSSSQFWPHPTGIISLSTSAVPASSELFELKIISSPSKAVSSHLEKAFQLFREDILGRMTSMNKFEEQRSVFVNIRVNISGSKDPRMLLDTDESYNLWLRPENGTKSLIVDISSNSFCGARHALETLSQLIWHDPYVNSLFIIEAATIDDAPRFQYRGLMVDTAQNYFSVPELLQTIDAMAACKLNTFHWHATNLLVFPLLINSLPPFARFLVHGQAEFYDIDDIRTVTKHARSRGIRTVLEVNLPAFFIKPLIGSQLVPNEFAYCTHPLSKIAFDLLQQIYSEIINVTEVKDVFHLGNKDVYKNCPFKYFNLSKTLWLELTQNALQRLSVANKGKLPNLTILWSSPFTDYLKNNLESIGIQTINASWIQTYTSGIRSIISHEDVWDLNNGHGSWFGSNGLPYNSWQRMYEHRVWTRKGVGRIIGGEATMWTATVGAGELASRIWPRAAAMAERLWSDRAEGATRSVHARLDVHRARLLFRGIHASRLWSLWCTHNTFTC